MSYTSTEDQKAYAAAHYLANKERYNPGRKLLKLDRVANAAREREAETAKKVKQIKAAKEKQKLFAIRPIKTIPQSLQGQLAIILREHYAFELPKNVNRKNRGGDGLPLSAWMLGANRCSKSKIESVTSGTARYPWTTLKASTEVLAQRIAKRYEITLFQQRLLGEYVGRRYRGQADEGLFLSYRIGIAGNGPMVYDEDRTAFSYSRMAFEYACEKYSLDRHLIPLRAILDERITMIFLLIQLNAVLRHTR